ncbi:hypothetical protein [Streptomyces sp. NBC_01296]|uniref:hypothetical protein n=1 Tax=Streptomyces sp. NBC_01296 TaxID=2903816 RepID=UPI002E13C4CC|nr:hypothetical protein OG299_41865 [Streptomyces sp. NBC_01296]
MTSQQFYARTLPDALALLNQLAPTLQALAITDQILRYEPKTMSCLPTSSTPFTGAAGHIIER